MRKKPAASTATPKNTKSPLYAPKVSMLVPVKYKSTAPIMISTTPKTFSAMFIQNDPSSSLMSTRPFWFVALLH